MNPKARKDRRTKEKMEKVESKQEYGRLKSNYISNYIKVNELNIKRQRF